MYGLLIWCIKKYNVFFLPKGIVIILHGQQCNMQCKQLKHKNT